MIQNAKNNSGFARNVTSIGSESGIIKLILLKLTIGFLQGIVVIQSFSLKMAKQHERN